MHRFSIDEAKTEFLKLVELVMQGEEIIILKAGKSVAKVVSFSGKPKRRLGVLKGKIKIADDFDAPLQLNKQARLKDAKKIKMQ